MTDVEKLDISQLGKTPNTQFAVNIETWWQDLPFNDRIVKAAEFGFPAIEFWETDDKDLDAFVELTEKHNLEISQFTGWGWAKGMNSPDNEDEFVEVVTQACETAKRLNCRKMTIVTGDDQPGMSRLEMHEQVIKSLCRVRDIVEEQEVMLIVEPMNERVDHPGHCLYGSEEGMRICASVNSDFVKLNWDLYHMQITEGDLCGRMKDGINYIGYLQLADHPGRHEPGTGEIYYPRVLKQAYQLGYIDYVGLECWPEDSEEKAARRVHAADLW
ncbi:MAG: hydroxypyruvate isomerase family protein [Pirellulales bacterium]